MSSAQTGWDRLARHAGGALLMEKLVLAIALVAVVGVTVIGVQKHASRTPDFFSGLDPFAGPEANERAKEDEEARFDTEPTDLAAAVDDERSSPLEGGIMLVSAEEGDWQPDLSRRNTRQCANELLGRGCLWVAEDGSLWTVAQDEHGNWSQGFFPADQYGNAIVGGATDTVASTDEVPPRKRIITDRQSGLQLAVYGDGDDTWQRPTARDLAREAGEKFRAGNHRGRLEVWFGEPARVQTNDPEFLAQALAHGVPIHAIRGPNGELSREEAIAFLSAFSEFSEEQYRGHEYEGAGMQWAENVGKAFRDGEETRARVFFAPRWDDDPYDEQTNPQRVAERLANGDDVLFILGPHDDRFTVEEMERFLSPFNAFSDRSLRTARALQEAYTAGATQFDSSDYRILVPKDIPGNIGVHGESPRLYGPTKDKMRIATAILSGHNVAVYGPNGAMRLRPFLEGAGVLELASAMKRDAHQSGQTFHEQPNDFVVTVDGKAVDSPAKILNASRKDATIHVERVDGDPRLVRPFTRTEVDAFVEGVGDAAAEASEAIERAPRYAGPEHGATRLPDRAPTPSQPAGPEYETMGSSSDDDEPAGTSVVSKGSASADDGLPTPPLIEIPDEAADEELPRPLEPDIPLVRAPPGPLKRIPTEAEQATATDSTENTTGDETGRPEPTAERTEPTELTSPPPAERHDPPRAQVRDRVTTEPERGPEGTDRPRDVQGRTATTPPAEPPVALSPPAPARRIIISNTGPTFAGPAGEEINREQTRIEILEGRDYPDAWPVVEFRNTDVPLPSARPRRRPSTSSTNTEGRFFVGDNDGRGPVHSSGEETIATVVSFVRNLLSGSNRPLEKPQRGTVEDPCISPRGCDN